MPVALPTSRTHRLARRHIDGGDAHLVTGVRHDLGCRVRVGLAAVSEDHVPADAHSARDGLADLARSNDDDDVAHVLISLLRYLPTICNRCSG